MANFNKDIPDLPENTGGASLDGSELFEVKKGTGLGSSQKLTLNNLASKIKDIIASFFATAAQGAKADTAIQSVVAGTNIIVDITDPHNPKVNATAVRTIVAGANISVDATDPNNPIITAPVYGLAGVNNVGTVTYTIQNTDNAKDIRCTNASAITVSVDTQANKPVPIGFACLISQGGAGTVTIAALSGVTLNAPNGATTSKTDDVRGLEYLGSNTWRVI